MKFEVELAEKADRDLRNIFFYIAVDLSAPENAERQINRLWDAILSVSYTHLTLPTICSV